MLKISIRNKGNSIDKFFKNARNCKYDTLFHKYGQLGVERLSEASPKDSGLMGSSWGYILKKQRNKVEIIWTNDNVENGARVALMVQYGHGARNGTYVTGIDFINPAMKPVFEELENKVWKEVISI